MKLSKIKLLVLALIISGASLTSCNTTKRGAGSSRYKTEKTEKSKKDKKEKKESKTNGDVWERYGITLDKKDNAELYAELESWIGTPYKYGKNDKSGTDCSGLVMEVFLKVFDIKLDRSSRGMFENNCKEIDKEKLKEADLVFFVTGSTGNISHVGIYLKDNKFIHASSSKGVTVSDLDQKYYIDHYKTSGRVKH